MNNLKFVSIKTILYDITRYPFVENIQAEDIALYLNTLLSLIGSPFSFSDKYSKVPIENYRGRLPCDMILINGTRHRTNSSHAYIPMSYSTDSFHSKYHECNSPDLTCSSVESYSINNGLMYTSFEEGEVEISYKGIEMDEDGLPMIPDNESFKQALKYYILWQYSEPARYRGEVTRDVYEDIKTQYFFYVGQATNSFNMLTPDRAKALERGLINVFQNASYDIGGNPSFNPRRT